MLRSVRLDDAASISRIYNHYVVQSHATFEEVPLTPEEMRLRIEETTQTYPWFVFEEDGQVTGYCYGRRWRERTAYRHSTEVSIYLHLSAVGRGTGSLLFGALLNELQARRFHSVIGGVSLPNPASVALLEKFGLEKVAHFAQVGFKLGKWIDVAYWQRLF